MLFQGVNKGFILVRGEISCRLNVVENSEHERQRKMGGVKTYSNEYHYGLCWSCSRESGSIIGFSRKQGEGIRSAFSGVLHGRKVV